jgi:hypothetical protein
VSSFTIGPITFGINALAHTKGIALTMHIYLYKFDCK